MSLTSVMCQLQGAGAADAGGDHGDAHLLRPGLRQREGRARDNVHLDAAGKCSLPAYNIPYIWYVLEYVHIFFFPVFSIYV